MQEAVEETLRNDLLELADLVPAGLLHRGSDLLPLQCSLLLIIELGSVAEFWPCRRHASLSKPLPNLDVDVLVLSEIQFVRQELQEKVRERI